MALGALGVEPASVVRVLNTCAPDIRERIEQKFPRADYATDSQWNAAVRDHLETVLHSELIPPDAEVVPGPELYDLTAFFYTPKPSEVSDDQLVETESKVIERLDTEIDRALKRLVQIKAIKQLMSSANLQLYAPDGIPFTTLPTSTSRTRKAGIAKDDLS